MNARLAAGTIAFVALCWTVSAWGHGADRVRRELSDQGFDQIEFTVAKAPFQVNACRGGERFHLHIDYFGKVTQETRIGPCDREASSDSGRTTEKEATSGEDTPIDPNATRAWRYWGRDYGGSKRE